MSLNPWKDAADRSERAANSAKNIQIASTAEYQRLINQGMTDAANQVIQSRDRALQELSSSLNNAISTLTNGDASALQQFSLTPAIDALKTGGEEAFNTAMAGIDKGRQDITNSIAQQEKSLTEGSAGALKSLQGGATAQQASIEQGAGLAGKAIATGAAGANDAILAGSERGIDFAMRGATQGGQALGTGLGQQLNSLQGGVQGANTALGQGTTQSINALNKGYGNAESALAQGLGQAQQTISQGYNPQIEQLQGGFGQAIGTLGQIQPGQQAALNQGYGAAQGTISGTTPEQLAALQGGVQQAVAQGQPYQTQGAQGLNAFSDAALNPNSAVFQRQYEQAALGLNKQLAARGLYNSGAGVQAQSELLQKMSDAEIQNQVARQQSLAQMGLGAAGNAQNILAQGGQNVSNVLGQNAGNLSNLQAAQGKDISGTYDVNKQIAAQQAAQGQALQGVTADEAKLRAQYQSQQGIIGSQNAADLATKQANVQSEYGKNISDVAMQGGVNASNAYGTNATAQANLINNANQAAGDYANNSGVNQAQNINELGKSLGDLYAGTGKAVGDVQGNLGVNVGNLSQTTGKDLASTYQAGGQGLSELAAQGGLAGADIINGMYTNIANAREGEANTRLQANLQQNANIANMQQQTGGLRSGLITDSGNNLASLYSGGSKDIANSVLGLGATQASDLVSNANQRNAISMGPVNAGIQAVTAIGGAAAGSFFTPTKTAGATTSRGKSVIDSSVNAAIPAAVNPAVDAVRGKASPVGASGQPLQQMSDGTYRGTGLVDDLAGDRTGISNTPVLNSNPYLNMDYSNAVGANSSPAPVTGGGQTKANAYLQNMGSNAYQPQSQAMNALPLGGDRTGISNVAVRNDNPYLNMDYSNAVGANASPIPASGQSINQTRIASGTDQGFRRKLQDLGKGFASTSR